ncbi:MAG: hypothetical protein M1829_002451 [Trizodia sp. TS-e1964]|nr:MAG: hypothetical protein M1829_002451 [Trizodia sp. TS-e1964]
MSLPPPPSIKPVPVPPSTLTPPNSVHSSERRLLPARALKALLFISPGRSSTGPTPWVFGLSPHELREVQAALDRDGESGFFEDKVHFDYFAREDRYILRMPSSTHESCIFKIILHLQALLAEYRNADSAAVRAFVAKVEPAGSPDLKLSDTNDDIDGARYNIHCPDISYRHKQATWPGVIIEVAFSQKDKKLGRLADDYILGSDGNIHAVVGIMLEYRGQGAWVSLWRPVVRTEEGTSVLECEQVVANAILIGPDGAIAQHLPDAGIALQLRDFASLPETLQPTALCDPVLLSYFKLAQIVQTVRAETKELREGQLFEQPLAPGVTKRKREISPKEELRAEDEEAMVEAEERTAAKQARLDPDYAR